MTGGSAQRRRLLPGLLGALLLVAGHAVARSPDLAAAPAGAAGLADAHAPTIATAPLARLGSAAAHRVRGLSEPLTTLAQYLEAFDAAYRPAQHELEALQVAESALGAAEHALQPRVAIGQSLAWDAFAELTLELDTGIEVPLISSTADAERSLAGLDLEARRLAMRLAGEEAYANLVVELADLAVVGWAGDVVAATASRLDAVELPWVGAGPTAERAGGVPPAHAAGGATPLERPAGGATPAVHVASGVASLVQVDPADRDAYDAYLRLYEAQGWLSGQSTLMTRHLARVLGLPAARLRPPTLVEIDEFLADRLSPPATLDVAACMSSSLRVEAARLRHAQHVANDSLTALPDYSLALTARLGYAFAPWVAGSAAAGAAAAAAAQPGRAGGDVVGGDLNAAIALEGRYHVPDGWPLGGTASLEVGPDGMWQRLDLAWPPLPTPRPVPADRDGDLADELAAIADELSALRSASVQATAERRRLQRQLAWAVLDAAPELGPGEVESAVEALLSPVGSASEGLTGHPPVMLDLESRPLLLLELAELRIQHAFARLGEVSAQVQFLAACGRL